LDALMMDKFPLDLGKGAMEGAKVSISTFVILHHTGHNSRGGGDHWDWLIQIPDYFLAELGARMQANQGDDFPGLLTFASEIAPFQWTLGTRFWRLAPHRNLYLDYQGPISGGRGKVHRQAAGELEWIFLSDFQLRFRLLRLGWLGECSTEPLNNQAWFGGSDCDPAQLALGASAKTSSAQYCLSYSPPSGSSHDPSQGQMADASRSGSALPWSAQSADSGQYWLFS